MKIVVCVKQTPDSEAAITVEDGKLDWGSAKLVINPWDEYSVEAALQIAKEQGGEVIVLSLGREDEREAIKHALAMGCNSTIQISDPALAGADSLAIAKVLAAAIQKIGDVDLAFFGKQAIDTDTGLTASMVSRLLGWPALTLLSAVESIADGEVNAVRSIEEGKQKVSAELPAVASVVKDYAEPRYPSFMGIRKAARAEVPVWSLADLDIEAPAAHVSWPQVMNPPEREVNLEMIAGDSLEEMAALLVEKIMEEKVL